MSAKRGNLTETSTNAHPDVFGRQEVDNQPKKNIRYSNSSLRNKFGPFNKVQSFNL